MGKEVLEVSKVSVNAVEYDITNVTYGVVHGKVPSTDTGTAAGENEFETLRAERTFSFDMFFDDAVADIATGTSTAIILDFEGKTYTGTGVVEAMDNAGGLDTMITQSFTGYFNGAVVVALEGA